MIHLTATCPCICWSSSGGVSDLPQPSNLSSWSRPFRHLTASEQEGPPGSVPTLGLLSSPSHFTSYDKKKILIIIIIIIKVKPPHWVAFPTAPSSFKSSGHRPSELLAILTCCVSMPVFHKIKATFLKCRQSTIAICRCFYWLVWSPFAEIVIKSQGTTLAENPICFCLLVVCLL